jgi:hypothetical protein
VPWCDAADSGCHGLLDKHGGELSVLLAGLGQPSLELIAQSHQRINDISDEVLL